MNERKQKLAKFLERSRTKSAARGGKKTSRKKIDSHRLKSLEGYHASKKKLSKLKAERDKLDAQLESAEKDMHDCRSEMLKLTDVLRNMDLADCNYVMMYDNTDDVGYIVDKEEHHLDVDENGDVSFVLMTEHRRNQRKAKKEEDSENSDDQDVNDADDYNFDLNLAFDDESGSAGALIPGIERLADPESPSTEQEHEELYEEGKFYPNFRFGE